MNVLERFKQLKNDTTASTEAVAQLVLAEAVVWAAKEVSSAMTYFGVAADEPLRGADNPLEWPNTAEFPPNEGAIDERRTHNAGDGGADGGEEESTDGGD